MPTERDFLRNGLRVAWWLGAAFLISWIVVKNLPPGGVLHASARPGEPNGFIGGLQPTDRVALTRSGDGASYEIKDEPVYLTLAAPRLYRSARVTLTFADEGQPLVEMGGRLHPERWEYDLRTLDAPMLDGLGWSARQDGGMRIYERKPTTRSAADLLMTSSQERIAVHRVDAARWGLVLPKESEGDGAEASGPELADARVIYLYVQEGPLEVSLAFDGAAPRAARLQWRGRTILTRTPAPSDRSVEFLLTGAERGLYRLELEAGEGVKLAGIKSRHRKLAYRVGGALVSPSKAAEFSPEFPGLTWQSDLKAFDAIVAAYAPPEAVGGLKRASAEFDLSVLARIAGRAQVLISVPAIRSNGKPVRIERVEVEYRRAPLGPKAIWDAVMRRLNPAPLTL